MSVMTPEEVADRWRVSGGERVGSVKGLAAAGRRAGLGHRDAVITSRVYAVFSPHHLRSAVSALEVGKVRGI